MNKSFDRIRVQHEYKVYNNSYLFGHRSIHEYKVRTQVPRVTNAKYAVCQGPNDIHEGPNDIQKGPRLTTQAQATRVPYMVIMI